MTAFVKKIARHTKSKYAALTASLLITCVCCKKTYVHDVQITPSTILEAAQVMGTILFSCYVFGSLFSSWNSVTIILVEEVHNSIVYLNYSLHKLSAVYSGKNG